MRISIYTPVVSIIVAYMVKCQLYDCDVEPSIPNADSIANFNDISVFPTNEYKGFY